MMEEPSIERAMASACRVASAMECMMSFQARLEQMRLDAEKLAVETQLDPLLQNGCAERRPWPRALCSSLALKRLRSVFDNLNGPAAS